MAGRSSFSLVRCVSLGVLGLVLGASMPSGCAKKDSRLEIASNENERARSAQLEQTQASLPLIPSTSTAPSGVPVELWTDLHWLPPSIVGLNGTPPGEHPILAQWFFSQPSAKHEDCQALKRGLARGYGIEWDLPPQSFVFFGTATFEQIEGCAKASMRDFGGSASMRDGALHLEMDGTKSQILFARADDLLVMLVDDGRMGPLAEASADRLEGNESLLEILASAPPSNTMWSASTRDMTQVPLDVPSLGYTMNAGKPGERWEFRFTFADRARAERATTATGPFFEQAEAFLGVPLHPKIESDAETVGVSLELTDLFTLSPEKLQAMQGKLEEFAAGRRSAEN